MARSHKGVIPTEHQAPAQKQKAQRRNRKDDEILGKDVDGVLRPREARLHRCEAKIHKKHQNRGKQDPESIDYHCNIHILLPPVQIDHKGCGAFDPPSAREKGEAVFFRPLRLTGGILPPGGKFVKYFFVLFQGFPPAPLLFSLRQNSNGIQPFQSLRDGPDASFLYVFVRSAQ